MEVRLGCGAVAGQMPAGDAITATLVEHVKLGSGLGLVGGRLRLVGVCPSLQLLVVREGPFGVLPLFVGELCREIGLLGERL